MEKKECNWNDRSEVLGEIQNTKGVCVTSKGENVPVEEEIVVEHFMNLFVNERLVAKLVCTPSDLRYLVLGRLYTEGLLKRMDDIESLYICEHGYTAKIYMKTEPKWQTQMAPDPTCCTGNRMFWGSSEEEDWKPVPKVTVNPNEVFLLAEEFANGSRLHGKTKGTHSCYLGVKGSCLYVSEDLGRHNAMDKCIGYMLENGISPGECMLFTTGRVPTDMVKKAVAKNKGMW